MDIYTVRQKGKETVMKPTTVPAPINGAPSIEEKTFWRDHAPSNRERLQYQKKFFEKIKPSNREYAMLLLL